MPRWTTSNSPVSSLSTRYLPRRSTPVILAPSSFEMNCFFVCRRTVRVPLTCAVFTRFPTTSRSRPRRMVSTSGSSGISVRFDRPGAIGDGLRLTRGAEVVPQCLPRGPSGGRLRLFLRSPFALASHLSPHPHFREEALRMIRSLVADAVSRELGEMTRRQLLEPGLVVLAAGAFAGLADAVAEQPEHESLDGAPTAGQVHGADHRLERVGEDRRLLPPAGPGLALAQQQRVAELE